MVRTPFALAWSVNTAGAETLVFEVARAAAGFDQRSGEPIVTYTMTEASKRMFGDFTAKNVGKKNGNSR
jgi:preprotein translocase subunit SecD